MTNIVPIHLTQVLPVYDAELCTVTGNWIKEPTCSLETTDPWSWLRQENTSEYQYTTYHVPKELFYRALRIKIS